MLTREWFDAQVAAAEADVRQAWVEYVRRLRAANPDLSIASRSDGLESLRGVDEESERLGSRFQALYLALAFKVATELDATFDPTNWRVQADMRVWTRAFVGRISADQRSALKRAREHGKRHGLAAWEMGAALGLTFEQVGDLGRYIDLLASSNPEPEDAAVSKRMAEAYAVRALETRTALIARTEATRLAYLTATDMLRQMVDRGILEPSDIEREWLTAGDERVRHTHGPMDGQVRRGLDEPFSSGGGAKLRFPGDPAAPIREIAGCRCRVVVRLRGAS